MPSSAPIRPDPTHARHQTLLDVAESIAAHRQLSTLFGDLSRCLSSLVDFDYISLTLLDEKSQTVRIHILEAKREVVGVPPAGAIPIDETPTGVAIRTRQPYYLADVADDRRFPIIHEILKANA